jgi:hypothetical protein
VSAASSERPLTKAEVKALRVLASCRVYLSTGMVFFDLRKRGLAKDMGLRCASTDGRTANFRASHSITAAGRAALKEADAVAKAGAP